MRRMGKCPGSNCFSTFNFLEHPNQDILTALANAINDLSMSRHEQRMAPQHHKDCQIDGLALAGIIDVVSYRDCRPIINKLLSHFESELYMHSCKTGQIHIDINGDAGDHLHLACNHLRSDRCFRCPC